MPNLAYSFTQDWQKHETVSSLPQMTLDDFHQVIKPHGHYQRQLTANYHGLTLSSAMQPIYSIDHQRVIGYEALIRAEDPFNQPISPLTLLEAPKKEVDNIYLDRLCRYLHIANFQHICTENNWLFINISAQASVKGRDYGLFFAELLEHFNIEPRNIVVEIIEDPTTDNEKLQEAATYYKNMGCLLAIDDFGAGHSNFERVWNLKPDIVKLDRTLLTRAETSKRTLRMMSSIVNLLHQAGCLVVIEGVETEEQALIAMDSGADFVQGFYFAKPQTVIPTNITANQDKSEVFNSLTNHFINLQTNLLYQESNAIELYCLRFREAILNLQQGLAFKAATEHLSKLPRSIRCFLTDAFGNQLESTIEFQQQIDGSNKFKQLKVSENANWFRKHYVQSALKNHTRIAISSPYRSVTGDGLCITISMSFNIQGQKHILCFDIAPNN